MNPHNKFRLYKLQQYSFSPGYLSFFERKSGGLLRWGVNEKKNNKLKLMLEPCAVKVARTVLRGGKSVRTYLSQLDTPVVLAENAECHRLP